MLPRRQVIRSLPAAIVWSLQVLSTTRERCDRLSEVFRSSLDLWNEASQPGGELGFCGFSRDRLRWGVDFVAPQASWRVPANFWRSGEGFWVAELGRGGLERKFADEGDFWSELAAGVCGEGLRLWWGLGLKLRWSEMAMF